MPREEAILLVERLMNPETPEEQSSEILTALQQGLPCPHISDYVFWSSDPHPTPEKVVDRAMAYRPIAL
ncbi:MULTISPECIES: e9imm peptide [Streptomyces]|uniref:E9imm peptide n=2 Tax=Streptomyces TaxID=1883 RepID=A0ABU4KK60_9ACTN|nr:e9imm peptide [Streptomyces roseolus]MDX2297934.1 e9imm peptide [Streptomyces roseolus]